MSEITLQEYQEMVRQQGQALLDIIQSVALGDLDVQVEVPEGVEILSDLAIGLEMMIDDLRDLLAEQERTRQQLQAALDEVLAIQQRYLRREWTDYLQPPEEIKGYIHSAEREGPTDDAWLPAMSTAVQRAETVLQRKEDGGVTLAVPIQLYGQIIGVIGFDRPDGQPWSRQEIATVESIVEQVGWALENQRLFDQEQQAHRQLRLRVNEMTCLNDIGRKIDERPPVDEFLEWVAQRIPAAMQFPDLALAAIRLGDDTYGDAQAFNLPRQIVQNFRVGEQPGQVCIAYREERDFLDEESALLGDIARRVGGYLENVRLLEETRTALNETQTLFRIARGLAQAQSQQEMFELVLTECLGALGLPQGGVMTLDPGGQYGILQALMQEGRLVEAGMRIPIADNLPTIRALETKEPVVVRDAYTDELTAQSRDLVDQLGYRSLLLVPIIVRGEAIGLLGADSVDEIHEFTEREIDLVRAAADQLGIAIEHQRLLEETRAALAEAQALHKAGERIAQASTVEEVAEAVTLEAGRLGVPLARFILAEPWGERRPTSFRVIAAWNKEEQTAKINPPGTVLPAGATSFLADLLLGRRSASPIYTLDGSDLPPIIRRFLASAKMRAVHYMPIRLAEQPVGIIALAQTRLEAFDERTVNYLRTLLIQVAFAVENRRLFEQTRQTLADTEALYQTGRLVNAAQSVDEVLDALLDYTLRLDVDRCLITLLEEPDAAPAERVVVVQAVWDRAGQEERFRGNRFTTEHFPAIGVLKPDQSLIVTDMATEEKIDEQTRATFRRLGVGAAAIIPISVGERLLGWFLAETIGRPRTFAAREIEALQSLIGQAAVAIQSIRHLQEAQARAEELTVLNELGQALAVRQDVTSIVENLYTYTSRLMELTSFYVALYDEQQDVVSFPLYIERGERHDVPSRQGAAGLTEYVIRTKEPLLLTDNVEQRLKEKGIQSIGAMAQSWLGVPILLGDRVLGMIAVQSYETPRLYGERQRDLLMAAASHAAIAIENSYLFAEAQERAHREQILRETVTTINASDDLIAGLPAITRHLRRLYPIDILSLTLYTPGEAEYTLFALDVEAGGEHFVQEGARLPLNNTAPGWVITHNKVWLDTDLPHHQRFREDAQLIAEGVKSRVILPLRVGSQVIGTLNLGSGRPAAFHEDDLPPLHQIADQMALALERARLLEETRTALAEAEEAHRAYLRKSWQEHLQQQEMLARSGFLYDRAQEEPSAGLVAVPDLWRPEMEKAVHSGAPAVVREEDEEAERVALAIPIRVRGQTIGVLGVEAPDAERRWTEDDLALVEAVSDQLGQTLESARLFADAQRRAERERLIGEITARIRASTDMRDIVRTTATELGRTLGTARVLVRVGLTETQEEADRSPAHRQE